MRKFLLTLLVSALPFLVCRAEDGPKLPDGVDSLPQDMRAKMADLLKNAEKYRGLKCIHNVPSGSLKEDALRVKMKMMFEEELPPAKMRPLQLALKAFGSIPESMDLNKYYPELLTSQVGGFYDPRRQYLVLVQREGGMLGKAGEKQYGKEMAEKLSQQMDDIAMVHELTHALQDQYFDLKTFAITDPLSDAGAARTALIEGDATMVMYDFGLKMRIENIPFADTILASLLKNPSDLIDASPDMPGAKEIKEAPAYFRDGLLFSYLQGYVFCLSVRKAGGQELLDYAFTKDPPRSTEQILHPEKWLGKRDDPIEITLPDLSDLTNGWSKVAEGTQGELGIKIFINDHLKDADLAETAAAGWGGDKYAVYEKDGALTLCWVTDWDTAKDAKEFLDAASKLGKGWQAVAANEKRVTVTHTAADAALVTNLHAALRTAKASTPENTRIDIAAVRKAGNKNIAKAEDDTNPLDLLKGLFGGDEKAADSGSAKARDKTDDLKNGGKKPEGEAPKLTDKNGGLDVDKLLDDPAVKNAVKQLGGDNGVDVGEMLKNPAMKEMLKSMLDQKSPSGSVSADGKTYTNTGVGVSLKLPDSAKDWKLNGNPGLPMALLLATGTDGGQVMLATQALPMQMPIETMGPFMEMGFKIALKNYKCFKQGVIGEGASKGYEYEISGESKEGGNKGVATHMLTRFYMRGGSLLVVTASAEQDQWTQNEKAIKDVLDGIKLSEPKKADKTLKE
ncbi:MAG TPA: hypothetical protein VKX17_26790 [Planctomycetota bacterium]|nr:hypothetical protein [Planctomycetota bacterium]